MERRVRLGGRKDEGGRDRGIHSRSLCTSSHSIYLIQLPDLYILQTSEGRRRDNSGTGGRGGREGEESLPYCQKKSRVCQIRESTS